jgi:hypothetical protein
MPILLRNLQLDLDEPEDRLLSKIAQRLRVSENAIRAYAVVHRSIDARRKDDIRRVYQIELALHESPRKERALLKRLRPGEGAWIEPRKDVSPERGESPLRERPMIVGFGPGGMFAALRLAMMGYRPIVLERGREVRRRHRDVMERFYRRHEFDPTSNLLFGEGGAGTYSDGKLYTRVNDPLTREVLEIFYQHGAPPEILIDAHPHIGSDRLPTVCSRIRRKIESLGGEVRFECRVDDVRIIEGRLDAMHVTGEGCRGVDTWMPAGPVILALGHSARDTIRMLFARGVRIDPKPFQLGVRIEHPQALVDRWQYGPSCGHVALASAEYFVVAKGAAGEHGDVFSFCMCPGGEILPTNESEGEIATNGASRANRSGPFANAGLVLTLDPTRDRLGGEFANQSGEHPAMRALAYLEALERRAFEATGRTYRVPAQRAVDFLAQRASDGMLVTSYPLGGQWTVLSEWLPDFLMSALHRGLPVLDGKMPGFAGGDAIITAPETRASSPIRIPRREETRESVSTANLYPVGEGAGYAGGIVSAAIDGIRTADAIICVYAPPA